MRFKIWFYQAWNAAGTQVQHPIGGCGLAGTHEFRIVREGMSGTYHKFVFRMDGVNLQGISTLSAASWAYGTSLVAISEPSSTQGSLPAVPNPYMATVTYSPAIQYYNCVPVCGWANIPGATVQRYLTSCPGDHVSYIGNNNVQTYWQNGGFCYAVGTHLW
jgi:hypothetical protein